MVAKIRAIAWGVFWWARAVVDFTREFFGLVFCLCGLTGDLSEERRRVLDERYPSLADPPPQVCQIKRGRRR